MATIPPIPAEAGRALVTFVEALRPYAQPPYIEPIIPGEHKKQLAALVRLLQAVFPETLAKEHRLLFRQLADCRDEVLKLAAPLAEALWRGQIPSAEWAYAHIANTAIIGTLQAIHLVLLPAMLKPQNVPTALAGLGLPRYRNIVLSAANKLDYTPDINSRQISRYTGNGMLAQAACVLINPGVQAALADIFPALPQIADAVLDRAEADRTFFTYDRLTAALGQSLASDASGPPAP